VTQCNSIKSPLKTSEASLTRRLWPSVPLSRSEMATAMARRAGSSQEYHRQNTASCCQTSMPADADVKMTAHRLWQTFVIRTCCIQDIHYICKILQHRSYTIKNSIHTSAALMGMTKYRIGPHRITSDHVWPCLQTRDRNFKSEAKKRWNYLQGEQATRHAVSSLQVRPPQKQY